MGAMQIVGTVAEGYNTLKPNSVNKADIGSISLTSSRAAVIPKTLAINGTPCGLSISFE